MRKWESWKIGERLSVNVPGCHLNGFVGFIGFVSFIGFMVSFVLLRNGDAN